MLRLIKRHLKICAKTSETDFECAPRGIIEASSKNIRKPRCPFHITGPHPLRPGKIFKESAKTSDERVATAKLLQRETQFFLEPDKVQPKAAKTLEAVVTGFLNTKKDTSDRSLKMPTMANDFDGDLSTFLNGYKYQQKLTPKLDVLEGVKITPEILNESRCRGSIARGSAGPVRDELRGAVSLLAGSSIRMRYDPDSEPTPNHR